jgi:NADH dehydrogenase
VRNLTGHPDRPDPFGGRVEVAPLDLDDPAALQRSLAGVAVLVNTYWIRFARGPDTHARAVARSRRLFAAARAAGVRRVVHVSITNPSPDSRLPYFRGKAEVEAALAETGLARSILRPAVFFGARDVLINNIAWVARRLPVIGVPPGDYGLQPIHVEDFARLAVAHCEATGDAVVDAIGPEAPRYRELVARIAHAVGTRPRIVPVPRWAVHAGASALGLLTRDVVLTRDEVDGLAENLLVTHSTPTGTTRLSEWLTAERETLGREWACELDRHFRPASSAG